MENQTTNRFTSPMSTRTTLYVRIGYLLFVFILGWIYRYFREDFSITDNDFFNIKLLEILGTSTGLLLITGIIGFVRIVKKAKPTIRIYIIYIVVTSLMFAVSFSQMIATKNYFNTHSNVEGVIDGN